MTNRRDRATDPFQAADRARKHTEQRRQRHRRRPCGGNRPDPPANLQYEWETAERGRWERISATLVWNEVTTNTSGATTKMDRYVVQIQRSTDGVDATGSTIRRLVAAKDEDANATCSTHLRRVRKKLFYRFRVMAVNEDGCRGAFSEWTSWTKPLDSNPPPSPLNVTIFDNSVNRVLCEWEAASDPDDADLVHPDVAYHQVQISTSPTFAVVYRRDRYVAAERKSFRIPKDDQAGTFYMRVRAVDASDNRSSWIPATAIGNSNAGAAATGVKIRSPRVVAAFTKSGALVASTHYAQGWEADRKYRIVRVRARVGRHDATTHPADGCPTGSAVTVNLWIANTDDTAEVKVFTNESRLTIPASKHKDAVAIDEGDGDFLRTYIDPNETMTVKVGTVGSTTPGSDLVVLVTLEPVE